MRAENAIEDRIDVAKLAIQIERVRQRGRVEILRNARVSGDSIAEARVAFECRHRVFLHGFVRLIARHSLFDDILQELTGVDEAVRRFEILHHALREDAHLADDRGHFAEHVIDEDRRVGQDDALDGAV